MNVEVRFLPFDPSTEFTLSAAEWAQGRLSFAQVFG